MPSSPNTVSPTTSDIKISTNATVTSDTVQPPSSSKPEKSIHESIHSQYHQNNRFDDEGHEDDDGAPIERAFSIVSLSLHRRPSVDSASTVSTIRDGSKSASVAPGSVDAKSLRKSGSEKEKKTVFREKDDDDNNNNKGSWWARIRGRNTEKRQGDVDGVYEKDSKAIEAQAEIQLRPGEEYYPDGGFQAWMMVFGGMCNTFSTFGFVNAWGIFQSYYQSTILKDSSPSSMCVAFVHFASD